MGSKMDQESDISDSEMKEYKEITYKLLKFKTHKIRDSTGKFRCPFCAQKEQVFEYTLLLQHAIRVAEGSEESAKQRANHFAMATYLVTDLSDEAEPPPPPAAATSSGDGFETAVHSVQECYQKLVEKLKEKEDELKEKGDELCCLILKETKSNGKLQATRKALIEGFMGLKDTASQSRVVIGVKKMGELDLKMFIKACKNRYTPRLAQAKAVEVCSSWQEKLRNPEWHPFRVQDCKKVVDDEDETLKGLKCKWGVEIYDAVVTALEELQEYNFDYKENGKAKLEEDNSCESYPPFDFKENGKAKLEEDNSSESCPLPDLLSVFKENHKVKLEEDDSPALELELDNFKENRKAKLKEDDSSASYPVLELWNFKENRKAELEEAINYLFTQLKTLKRKRA